MMRSRRRLSVRGHETGAVLLLVAIMLAAFLACLALAIDGGALQRTRRLAQNAADAGALAGAAEILRSQSDSVIFASAQNESARNGFAGGSNGVVVTATHPGSGSFTGSTYVKVVVEDTVPTIFAGAIGRRTMIVRATAIGGIVPPSTNCLTLLSPTGTALSVQSAFHFEGHGTCNIAVNSSSSTAIVVQNNGSIIDGATTISVAGNYSVSSGGSIAAGTDIKINAAPVPDTMAYLTMPTPPACPTGYSYCATQPVDGATLSPGSYCGGIKIGGGYTVTFSPGLYFLRGGGLDIGSSAIVNGTGVTFVNTNAPAIDGGANKFNIFNFQSGAIVTLSAMTTGALSGVLLYQDPAAGQAGHSYTNSIKSGNGSILSGSIYLPTQTLSIQSAGSLTINGGIVAKTLSAQSSGTLNLTGISGGTGYFALRRSSIVQ